ncbi:MAG: nucleotidyltransferase family protein [Ilumatobacter sp.]
MSKSALNRLGRAAPARGELELLRAAVLEPELAAQAWQRWRLDHDVDAAHWRSHALLPAISHNVADECLGDDAGILLGIRRRTWASNQLLFAQLAHALDHLGASAEHVVVSKGVALATTVYPASGLRTMGDIDVIVGVDGFTRTCDDLKAHDWQEGPDFEHQSFMHASSMLSPDGHELDVHRWMLFPRFTRIPDTGMVERSVAHTVAGRSCRRFTLADELVVTVLHGARPEGSSTVRWPCDVAHLLRSVTADPREHDTVARFWSDVMSGAEQIQAGRPLAAGLAFCVEELGLDVPNDVIDRLHRTRPPIWIRLERLGFRLGLQNPSRLRQYIDTERAAGRRPSPTGYVRLRRNAALQGGGLGSIVRRRWLKLTATLRSARAHSRTW